MSKIQSKELTAFYRAYKKWLDEGAPQLGNIEPIDFVRSGGLCYALIIFFREKPSSCYYSAEKELLKQFTDEGLDTRFPFGESSYSKNRIGQTQHLDPLRIKWVEDHLKPEFTGERG